MTPIRVLSADDHESIIEGLTHLLPPFEIEVVASAATTAAVIPTFESTKPDVVVLDVRFGEGDTGLDVLRSLISKHPEARVVVFSQFAEDEIISDAYRSGARAFIPKDRKAAVLAEAIRQASVGKIFFLPEIAERLALLGVRGDESPRSKLDERELEVFRLMALGKTNIEIAANLDLSPKTISTTSQSVKDKLGMHRAADITRLAVKHKIIDI